jgi:GntR family transcriptional regulator, colanic acid and biofilm gene transcriptional regulator
LPPDIADIAVTLDLAQGIERGQTLTEQVYEILRRGLLMGAFAPDLRLSTRQLAREMSVSLTPVREAMMRLVNEGALEMTDTRSFRTPVLTRENYAEIVSMREALEPIAVAGAARLITADQVAEVARINEDLREAVRTDAFARARELDTQFHLTVYQHSRQPLLVATIYSLLLRAGPTRTRLANDYRKTLTGYEHHRRILDALSNGAEKAAAEAVARDIHEGSAVILELLDD